MTGPEYGLAWWTYLPGSAGISMMTVDNDLSREGYRAWLDEINQTVGGFTPDQWTALLGLGDCDDVCVDLGEWGTLEAGTRPRGDDR